MHNDNRGMQNKFMEGHPTLKIPKMSGKVKAKTDGYFVNSLNLVCAS